MAYGAMTMAQSVLGPLYHYWPRRLPQTIFVEYALSCITFGDWRTDAVDMGFNTNGDNLELIREGDWVDFSVFAHSGGLDLADLFIVLGLARGVRWPRYVRYSFGMPESGGFTLEYESDSEDGDPLLSVVHVTNSEAASSVSDIEDDA